MNNLIVAGEVGGLVSNHQDRLLRAPLNLQRSCGEKEDEDDEEEKNKDDEEKDKDDEKEDENVEKLVTTHSSTYSIHPLIHASTHAPPCMQTDCRQ